MSSFAASIIRFDEPPTSSGPIVTHSSSTIPAASSWPLSVGPPSHSTTPAAEVAELGQRGTRSTPLGAGHHDVGHLGEIGRAVAVAADHGDHESAGGGR